MDSDNILSIINGLGQGAPPGADAPDVQLPGVPQNNVMQQAAAPPPQSPNPQFQDPTAQIAHEAAAASPPMPKPRRSLLDTIGRISDVLAKVGGAEALYQPTLDAATARANAASDHDLATQKAQVDLATGKFDLGDKQREAANGERERFASVLGAVNDAEDAGNMPAMMAAAGLTDARYAPFVKMVQSNPEVAKTLASALGGDGSTDKLGHNLYFGTDQSGKTIAYQIGDDGQAHILNFNGVTPGEPSKVVNTGDKSVLVGSQTGGIKRILPNSVSPNTVANNKQSDTNNRRTTSTQITIAGMPARAKGGAANSKGAVEDPNIPMYLNNIRQGFADLHSMQALPGEGGALNQVEGAFGRSALGQKLGEQAGTPAAQKRLAVVKNISQLQQAMLKSLPASATRTKFEQEMLARGLPDPAKMDFNTANTVIDQLYASYQNALKSAQPASAPAAVGTGGIPTLTPEQAAKLPSGARFRTTDGRELVRH